MEKEHVTIKDIAEKAGVSIGAVHCAINGKRGVGEETRKRILDIARQYDYRPNTAAASLKRKTIRIAAVIPGLSEDNQYYFTYFWDGLRSYLEVMKDFKVVIREVPYYRGSGKLAEELENLCESGGIDGVLCAVSYMDGKSLQVLQQFADREIPVVLVGEDIPDLKRLCCVQPGYDMIGRTIAELLTRQISPEGAILVCAGEVKIPPHYKVIFGMDAYLKEHGKKNLLYKIHYQNKKNSYEQMVRYLRKTPEIAACFSVTARESVLLGMALKEIKRAGFVAAVGSEIVFQSSLSMYENNGHNRLLL